MISNVEVTIREYISGLFHLSLATSVNDKPWICEVHFAYDDHLNLYFASKTFRRHSQEIEENTNVAGNIIATHAVGQKVRGVYFEGTVERLDALDVDHPGFRSFSERFHKDPSYFQELTESDDHRLYKISVDTYYLFDGRETTPGQKYELPWLKK